MRAITDQAKKKRTYTSDGVAAGGILGYGMSGYSASIAYTISGGGGCETGLGILGLIFIAITLKQKRVIVI